MDTKIDSRYNTFSTSIIFHLLHNNEKYKNLWVENYPLVKNQANNYFDNENCGCRPVLLQNYRKFRFDVDLMTVNFILKNPDVLNFDEFCTSIGNQEIRGTVFSVNNNPNDFKDFLSTIQQKNYSFNYFNTQTFDDKIIISFF